MSIKAKTIDGKLVSIEKNQLDKLQTQLRGKLITPNDDQYAEACKIWNAMIEHKPAMIVQCQGTVDIIRTVQFANENRLLISVRGGGHNIAGRCIYDDILLIDLSKMRSVQIIPEKAVAIVEPGATLADVDHETQYYGLALPMGINSTTGIAGLTLGGGFGWLSRKYGMTIDHLLSAELVTVQGKRLICDKNNHSDLFWAIRGGGGNFGIITSFTFSLNPVGPEVIAGPLVFKFEDAKKVLKNYRAFCKTSPEELSTWAVLRNAPPFPFIDHAYHGKPVLILATLFIGPIDKAKDFLEKLHSLGNPLGDGIAPLQFSDFERAFDQLLTPGLRNYWKSHNFKELSDELIDVTTQYIDKLPSPHTEIFIAQMGSNNRIPKDATAYPHRDIEFIMNVHTRWEKPNEDEKCISWARAYYKATEPFAEKGVYANFVSEGDDNIEEAYSKNLLKLKSIKAKYDPENVLRANLNISPV